MMSEMMLRWTRWRRADTTSSLRISKFDMMLSESRFCSMRLAAFFDDSTK